MTTARRTRPPGQPPVAPPVWTPPEVSADQLTIRFADSLLDEFVLGHSFDDVLRELVQNEYDASGTQMSVNFGVDALEITGSGKPIDADGWKRLSVMLGTGNIIGDTQQVAEKANGIGSKNQGLRSLFLFGDQIYVRSDGKQTVLDVRNGALGCPLPDPSSKQSQGVRITVPYRTQPQGKLEPFTIERERALIDRIATELASTLIKLANPGRKHSITSVWVNSKRCGRQLAWRQSVKPVVARGLKGTLLRRSIRTDDSGDGTERPARTQTIEELEFQRVLSIPAEFRQRNIPAYFVLPARRIRLALSFRMRGKRIDRSQPGHYFYPLGARDGATGIALSVCAPFEMNTNRSDLIVHEASPWNRWLLDQAIAVSQELLTNDWLVRFEADAYLALFHLNPSPAQQLAYMLHAHLGEATCWPTRARLADQPKQPVFKKAADVVVPDAVALDGLLTDRRRYLDDRLGGVTELRKVVEMCGAWRFSTNSLVRLRCAGKDAKALETQLKEKEANYYYTNFPDGLQSQETQQKLAAALDAVEQRLSSENKADLRATPTTLAADGSLAPCKSLQAIDLEMEQISPVPPNRRLHPALLSSRVLRKLAQPPNPGVWVQDAAARVTSGTIGEQEREALYRYIIQHGMQLSREVRRTLKSVPVLRNQYGTWVAPGRIIIPKARGVEQIKAALDLPHPDYAHDTALADALFFRKKIASDDLVAYAQIVAQEPQRAADFERFLQRNSKLITDQVARRLQSIPFLAATRSGLSAPTALYLRNEINQACLGDSVDYPAGRSASLYKRLRGQRQPRAQDIVTHLTQLRGQGRPPARPEVLYPELVRGLQSDGKKATAHVFDPILWTSRGYHQPYDVLLGAKHRAIFEGAVPISDATSELFQAYRQLGAVSEPQAHHWLTLLVWHEQHAGAARQTTTPEQRRMLHQVYMNIPLNYLSQIPDRRRWLLGRDGRLYAKQDISQHRLLRDDDPDMADTIAQQASGISFFETRTNQRLLQIAHALGIKRLTEARQLVSVEVGPLSSPPRGLRTEQLLEAFTTQDHVSAMHALVMHRYHVQLDPNIATPARLQSRLDMLHEVVFSKDIKRRYEISGIAIEVSTLAAIKDSRLILTPNVTDQMARHLIAQALAELFVAEPEQQRNLSTTLYALLSFKHIQDVKLFMRDQGVRWTPTQPSQEEDNIDQKLVEQLSERLIQSASSSDTNPAPGGQEAGEGKPELTGATAAAQGNGAQPSTPVLGQTQTAAPPAPSLPVLAPLPPIEIVRPRVVPASANWSLNTTSGGSQPRSSGRLGTGGGDPRVSERRETEIGQRGEELVYRYEQERVRQLGLPVERVKWVSFDNPNANHDFLSVDDDGGDLWIEVKATTGKDGRFEWSRAEFELARLKRQRYLIWRVYEADTETPTLREFRDPIALFSSASIDLDVGTLIVKVEPLS